MTINQEADWLSVDEARARILTDIAPLESCSLQIMDSLGLALAEPLVSPIDLPPWDNSAMDGFAVITADILGASPSDPRVLKVVGDVPAGQFPATRLGPGEAMRVMTGAPVPDGADAVIRVEHTDGGSGIGTAEGAVQVFEDGDANRNIRERGEDIRKGDQVLDSGSTVGPAVIGVASSMGYSRLTVHRTPTVGILTSGDELVELDEFDEVLAGRKIVSSNTYTLAAQLAELGFRARVLGIAADTPDSVRRYLELANGCDAVVTSAGISVGEHDYLRSVLLEMGTEIAFWRVRMKPGSAFAFGRIGELGGIPWFGLPGNPVSTMVTFEIFVRPALLRMAGHRQIYRHTRTVRLTGDIPGRVGSVQFPRAKLHFSADGEALALLTGSQGSGILSSMAAADALLIIPEDSAGARAGDQLEAIILGGQASSSSNQMRTFT
ncbi:MAG TPA: gephyrin-like molybdotransferase Glp [Longimicrobiaceae bacterium]|nr:gephyrin-like molybdotransferase Glp [Longimicrobiaceae bacterium]